MSAGLVSRCLLVLLLVAGNAAAQCRVQGVVRSADKSPLVGATVRVNVAGAKAPLTGTTDEEGRYSVDGVKAGSWVRLTVLRSGGFLGEGFGLITEWVQSLDIDVRPASAMVTSDSDLNPEDGASGSIGGVVRTADGVAVSAARVSISRTNVSAMTDAAGRFAFYRLRSGLPLQLEVSAAGYRTGSAQVVVPETGWQDTNFTMEIGSADADTATEDDADPARAHLVILNPSVNYDGVVVQPRQVRGIPALEHGDVTRAMQFLSTGSGSATRSPDLFVRGSDSGDQATTFDDFTLYAPQRIFGVFTPFNPDAIDSVDFSRTEFRASDGGRMAGSARFTGRSGLGGKPTGYVDLSALGAKATVSVPFGDKGSFLIAGRRSLTGSLYDRLLDYMAAGDGKGIRQRAGAYSGGPFQISPSSSFQDVNGKFQARLTRKDMFSGTFYDGRENGNNTHDTWLQNSTSGSLGVPSSFVFPDDITLKSSDLQRWTARGMSASWARQWTPAFSSKVSMGRSQTTDSTERSTMLVSPRSGVDYSYAQDQGGSNGLTTANDVRDTTFRAVGNVNVGFAHAFSFGAEYTTLDASSTLRREVFTQNFVSGAYTASLMKLLSLDRTSHLTTFFVENAYRPASNVVVTPGLRVVSNDLTGVSFIDPRINASYQLGPWQRFKAGWAVDHQEINRLTFEDRLQGDRQFWALSDGSVIPVSRTEQVVAGWSIQMPGVLVDIEAYYKKLDDLTMVAPRLYTGMAPDSTTKLFHYGRGVSRGFEATLQQQAERNTVWVSYAYTDSRLSFPTLEAGIFPSSFDEPHVFRVVDSFRIRPQWSVSGTWVLGSGRPYTLTDGVAPVYFPNGTQLNQVLFQSKNNDRITAYHRLDVSTEREFQFGMLKSTAGVSVFNIYNQQNVWYRQLRAVGPSLVMNDMMLMGRVVSAFLRVGF